MNRRKLITGLVSFVAAPAIVRVGSIMPVKVYDQPFMTLADYSKMIDPNTIRKIVEMMCQTNILLEEMEKDESNRYRLGQTR